MVKKKISIENIEFGVLDTEIKEKKEGEDTILECKKKIIINGEEFVIASRTELKPFIHNNKKIKDDFLQDIEKNLVSLLFSDILFKKYSDIKENVIFDIIKEYSGSMSIGITKINKFKEE